MPPDVLLVNDDRELLRDWALALLGTGHRVVAVDHPMKALTTIEAGEAADVMVTRIGFGRDQPNGVSLANMVRRKRPTIKVVFVGAPENAPHTEKVGLFLRKPADGMDLVNAVKAAMELPSFASDRH